MDPLLAKWKPILLKFQKIWTGVLVLLLQMILGRTMTRFLHNIFWHLVQPHKTILVQALVGAILFTVLGLAMSIYIQKITDYVFWWMAIGNNL
jgi:ATP-binding cassette subfamily B protein